MSRPRTARRSASQDFRSHCRSNFRARRLLLAATALLLGVVVPAHAEEPLYPEPRQLRELQLLVFDCARENRDPACRQAREQADPLLDHPRLPGSCKDTLWQIREQAEVVPGGGFERRDRLDRAATDLLRFCRAGSRPVTQGKDSGSGAPEKRSGFGLVPSP